MVIGIGSPAVEVWGLKSLASHRDPGVANSANTRFWYGAGFQIIDEVGSETGARLASEIELTKSWPCLLTQTQKEISP